jgi:transcriptional regulator with XRE-family HTH domain
MSNIGRRLMQLRAERSRKEIADALGITKSAIAMYERGERIPKDKIKIRIANLYGKSVEELFFTEADNETLT